MSNIPEQLSALNKSNVDAFVALLGITSTGAERIVDLQLKTAKAAFEESVKNARTLTDVKDPQDWIQLGTHWVQPAAGRITEYARQWQALATETQAEVTRYVEAHVATANKQVVSWLDQAAKTGPAGSDVAVAAAKSAVAAANQAYDVFAQAGRQVAEVTEATVQSVANAGLKAANGAAHAGKKKAV
jgi:phasin family protein